MQIGAATGESRMGITQKVKNWSAFQPSNSTSGNISKGTQNTNSKEHKHPYVHCSIVYNHQDMEAVKCPSVSEWIKQLWDIYTMEFYWAIKKKKVFILWDSMDGPREHYAKWNKQSEKHKYHTISLYVKSNEQTKLTRKVGTDSKTERGMTAERAGVRRWRHWAKGRRTHGHGQQCGDCWVEGI